MHFFRLICVILIMSLFFTLNNNLLGQDVQAYFNELNNSDDRDEYFDSVIDSLWREVLGKDKLESVDAVIYRDNVSEKLLKYYFDNSGGITGEKSSIFGFFVLLRNKDYIKIIKEFEARNKDYSPGQWIATYPIYRKAIMLSFESSEEIIHDRLASFSMKTENTIIRKYIAEEMDLKIGQMAPTFSAIDLDDNLIDTSTYKGKMVVLDFWATWCGPCIKELPSLRALHEEFKSNEEIVFIGVSLDEDENRLKKFVAENNISWPQIRDDDKHDGYMSKLFRAEGIPKYLIISKEGRIIYNSSFHDFGKSDSFFHTMNGILEDNSK